MAAGPPGGRARRLGGGGGRLGGGRGGGGAGGGGGVRGRWCGGLLAEADRGGAVAPHDVVVVDDVGGGEGLVAVDAPALLGAVRRAVEGADVGGGLAVEVAAVVGELAVAGVAGLLQPPLDEAFAGD